MQTDNRLESVFKNRKSDQKIMSLFITSGYPEIHKTVDLILELEASGADIIELGMPFSDPLADGPTIQYASKVALEQGVNLDVIFEQVEQLRKKSEIPVVLMGYINPVMRYGMESFFKKASASGVDGVILPDAPAGEYPEMESMCDKYGVAPIYLVAPNTPDERMEVVDKASKGFVYCVSVTGVTGARERNDMTDPVRVFLKRVRSRITKNPVLVGFGIRSHQDAMRISSEMDGFIVGSALIDHIRQVYPSEDWISSAGRFVKSLKTGKTEANR